MTYSTEQLDFIKEYAGYLLPVTSIAALLGLNPERLRMDINTAQSDAYKAYQNGKAETLLKLRKQEVRLAEIGSPLAVQLAGQYIQDMEDDE